MTDTGSLLENLQLIEDLARFSAGVLTEAQVRRKYRHLDNDIWEKLNDDRIADAIEAQKEARIRDGRTKRELAQIHVVAAPQTLNEIMLDPKTSPRHRVDAIKALDGMAANGPQAIPPEDRFIITIVMNEDVIRFDKPRAVGTDDSLNSIDTAALAAIAADKPKDDGNGDDHI
jgi:hypothetical protein